MHAHKRIRNTASRNGIQFHSLFVVPWVDWFIRKYQRRLRCAGEESRLHLIEKNSHDEADPDTLSASLPSSRRQLITRSASVLAVASWGAASADLAFAKVPSGFNPLKDVPDNYAFLYPFGWSEVQVKPGG